MVNRLQKCAPFLYKEPGNLNHLLKPPTSFQGDLCHTYVAHQELTQIKPSVQGVGLSEARLPSEPSHLILLAALHLKNGFRPFYPSGLFLWGWRRDTAITLLDFPDGSCLSLTESPCPLGNLSARLELQNNEKKGQVQGSLKR